MPEFKDMLKYFRMRENLSQSELAVKLGLSSSTVSMYEVGKREPDFETEEKIADFFNTDLNTLRGRDTEYSLSKLYNNNISNAEIQHIEKYRNLDPRGKSHVDSVLQWETDRMKELQAAPAAVVEFHRPDGEDGRFLKYFRSASAGTGVFILGNEVTEQIAVPDTPESRQADFAIKVSGDSMIPDYEDGDIVMVSQKAEMNHGDVGIFIVNNNVYIKEYGETELISKNPASENIQISEYDNIVCMGKVIGKIPIVS